MEADEAIASTPSDEADKPASEKAQQPASEEATAHTSDEGINQSSEDGLLLAGNPPRTSQDDAISVFGGNDFDDNTSDIDMYEDNDDFLETVNLALHPSDVKGPPVSEKVAIQLIWAYKRNVNHIGIKS
eukprot:gene1647-1831_t